MTELTRLKHALIFIAPLVCLAAAGAQTLRQDISIQQRMIVLESDGSRLKVNELYKVQLDSLPGRTKAAPRTFEIYLPEGAAVEQVTARSAGTASVKTSIAPMAEKNRYAVTYPVHPGQTQFTVTYTLPYSGQLRINPRITAATAQLMVVAPDSMRMVPESNSALLPADDPQLKSVTVYVAGDVTPQSKMEFEVQGSGSLARSQKQGSPASPAGSASPGASRSGEGALAQEHGSARLASVQWIFLAVLLLCLAAGATYIYSVNHAAAQVSASSPAPSLLDEMKEEMFQLESDRLEGKLSREEYEAAKAALDRAMQKIL